MKIKFQADNDLDEDILRAAKRLQPGMDFQRAPELDLHTGIPDPEVLRLCAEENRILVTHDRPSMPDHFSARRSSSFGGLPITSASAGNSGVGRRQLRVYRLLLHSKKNVCHLAARQ